MIANRIARALFASAKREIVPKPPRLLSGQLESFRFSAENAEIYDGYTLDELYGAKVGVKHPKKIQTQMYKDTFACGLLLVIGVGVILHINNLFKAEYDQIKNSLDSKLTRKVTLPDL